MKHDNCPYPYPYPHPKPKEKECNCCIEIEDSVVVIICGEVDFDRLRDSLNAFADEKGKGKYHQGHIIYPQR